LDRDTPLSRSVSDGAGNSGTTSKKFAAATTNPISETPDRALSLHLIATEFTENTEQNIREKIILV
jgi:hypothetical protein